MRRKITFLIFLLTFLASGGFAYALPAGGAPFPTPDSNATPNTISDIFQSFALGNQSGFFPVIILVGVVTLLAGIIGFVSAGDNEEKRSQGRAVMIFGIVVLFVMISFWGFVKILTQSFTGKNPTVPSYLPPLK